MKVICILFLSALVHPVFAGMTFVDVSTIHAINVSNIDELWLDAFIVHTKNDEARRAAATSIVTDDFLQVAIGRARDIDADAARVADDTLASARTAVDAAHDVVERACDAASVVRAAVRADVVRSRYLRTVATEAIRTAAGRARVSAVAATIDTAHAVAGVRVAVRASAIAVRFAATTHTAAAREEAAIALRRVEELRSAADRSVTRSDFLRDEYQRTTDRIADVADVAAARDAAVRDSVRVARDAVHADSLRADYCRTVILDAAHDAAAFARAAVAQIEADIVAASDDRARADATARADYLRTIADGAAARVAASAAAVIAATAAADTMTRDVVYANDTLREASAATIAATDSICSVADTGVRYAVTPAALRAVAAIQAATKVVRDAALAGNIRGDTGIAVVAVREAIAKHVSVIVDL